MDKAGFFKRKFEENKFVWGSFVLAAMIMLAAYIFLGYFPMGDNIILKVDMYHQYGPFHEELRNRLVNGKSFLYSWESGLGRDFLSQFAYYTASPLSFLMVLFPQGNMPEAMALFILLKVAFSASFFAFYLKRKFKRDDITIVIFAIMYSSMAFITSYYWNVMWLDAVAIFPLVALGIESLVKDKKYKLYCISLAIVILVNFYIAFLVCIFAGLYFVIYTFSVYSWKKEKIIIINRFIQFAFLSVIAGGISMVLTVPTAVALSHTQASDTNFPTMKFYENVYQLVTNHFVGARPVVLARNEDLPNLYSGLLTVLLVPFYYLNTRIKLKEKVLFSLFLLFMLLCSCVNTLDFIIHGFHFPSNLPHRFTFIYSFGLLAMTYKGFINLKGVRKLKGVYIFIGVFAAIIAITEYVITPLNPDVERVLADYDIVINVVIGLVYFLFLYQIYKGKRKDVAPLAGLIVIIFAECIFSTTSGIAYTGLTQREKYVKYIPGVERTIDFINEKDGENAFNRMEMSRFVTINEGSLYHFKGYSLFSSLAYGDTSQLMQDLGIAATSNSYRLYDPTPLFDSMFNIKYVVSRDNPLKNTKYKEVAKIDAGTDEEVAILNKVREYVKECTGSTDLSVVNDLSDEQKNKIKEIAGTDAIKDIKGINQKNSDFIYVYENENVLPLGFMVDSDAIYWDTALDNPFDVQNDFIFSTTDVTDKILNEIPISENIYENVKITNDEEAPTGTGERNISKYELTKPKSIAKADTPKVTTKVKVDSDQHVYLYVDAGNAKRAVYTVEGNRQDRELSTGRSLLDIGNVKAGSEITLELELTRKGEYEKTYRKSGTVKVYAAAFDDEAFKKAHDKLISQPMEISEYGDDFINASVNAKKDGLLYTSIPFDKGWSIKVDGKEIENKADVSDVPENELPKNEPYALSFASNGLLGVYMPAGQHTIEFSYYPVGFNMGIAITLISLLAFGVYIFIMEKGRKKEDA